MTAAAYRRSLATLVAVAWCGSPGRGRAEPPSASVTGDALTEARVVSLAAARAPAVLAARQDAAAAAAERDAAARARWPDVVVTASYTRLSSLPERQRTLALPAPGGSQSLLVLPEMLDRYDARVALVVPLSDAWLALASTERAAGRLADARAVEAQAAQTRVAYEARVAYVLYRRALAGRRIAATALEVATALAADQARRADAGTAPASSTLTFEAARDAAGSRLHQAAAEVAAAEATVRTFLPPELQAAPLSPSASRAEQVEPAASVDPPALRAAGIAISAADARIDAETEAMLPHLSLVAGVDLASPSARSLAPPDADAVPSWDVTLQLSWSLSSLTTGTAKRDRARAERAAAVARADQLRRQLEAERTAARAARASARERLGASDRAVATATRLAEVRRNETASGVATPLDVTTAESERVRAELEREDAGLELELAEARLAFAAGWSPVGAP